MDPEFDEPRLTWQERRKVVGVSLGFVLILGMIVVPTVVFMSPSEVLQEVFREFPRKRSMLTALLCVTVSGAFILFSLTLIQGLRGKRTGTTEWLLREMHHRSAQDAPMSAAGAEASAPGPRGILRTLVEWIPIGVMVLVLAVLYLISRANR